jgi:hypothetical protein
LAPDHRSALRVSELIAFVAQAMKTAGRRNPNRWVSAPGIPSPWRGKSELSLVHEGWEATKTPAAGEVFFLDFPLYRTSQDLGQSFEKSKLSGTEPNVVAAKDFGCQSEAAGSSRKSCKLK